MCCVVSQKNETDANYSSSECYNQNDLYEHLNTILEKFDNNLSFTDCVGDLKRWLQKGGSWTTMRFSKYFGAKLIKRFFRTNYLQVLEYIGQFGGFQKKIFLLLR